MRTSSQLTKVDQCEFHPRANISQTSDTMIRSNAQKNVILRMLQGEPITDIGGEIDNILSSKRCEWENNAQRSQNLILYDARIQRYLNYINTVIQNAQLVFPTGMDTTVDFFGETVKVQADFFTRENGVTTIHKIKTGHYTNEKDDINTYEAYVLGLLGKKLFPNDQIKISFDHLADTNSQTERRAICLPYTNEKKISSMLFTTRVEEEFEARHADEMQNPTACTPEECAGCSMYNICHFEEPPISVDIMKEVKPISEIRLTHAQQQVIDYEEGVARINAGAGAGKTLVIAMRIVELLKKGYEPEDICLLTFTNAGAGEMTARVVQYCAGNGLIIDPARLTSTTFNAFCHNLIKEHYAELGYTAPPRVLPDETKSGMINRILDQFPRVEEWAYSAMTSKNKWLKNALNSAKSVFAEIKKERYTREDNPWADQYSPLSLDIIFQMYEEFQRVLKSRNMIEFDDQIAETFRLLEVHPTLFEELGYRHIIVDEFQDTDLPQIHLLNQINDTTSFKSFMAVGDDSQAIFSFRHTSPEYMINFEQYFGHCDDFNLVENHRSAEDIIGFANQVNALNENRVEKDLIATKPAGSGPIISGFYSQKSEYEWIARQIQLDIESGKSLSDIAFLASNRNELTKMASILTDMGIPSILMNPIPYITNSRVAAVVTLFESFLEGTTKGLLDYKNVLLHGALKGASAQQMEEIATEFEAELRVQEKNAALFLQYAKALDPEEQDECFQSFLEKFEDYTTLDEMSEFFHDFKLYGNDSCFKREGKYDGVCLTTVHSAKGLEWDVTYLSLSKFDDEKLHKSIRSLTAKQIEEKEEINRKWFVGATRAREKLVMTGEFVVKMSRNDLVLNEYVRQAYDMLGRVYPYSSGEYWAVREAEKAEMRRSATSIHSSAIRTQPLTPDIMPSNSHAVPSGHSIMDLYRGRLQAQTARATTQTQTQPTQEDFTDSELEFV